MAGALAEGVDSSNFLNGGIQLAKITARGSTKSLEVNNPYMAASRLERFGIIIPGKETKERLEAIMEVWDVEHRQVSLICLWMSGQM